MDLRLFELTADVYRRQGTPKLFLDSQMLTNKQNNILTIGVFGSVARGESGNKSDVYIMICISEPDFLMLTDKSGKE